MSHSRSKWERLLAWWRGPSETSREEWLDDQYTPIRSYFKAHAAEYEREQRWLDQAGFDVPVDRYLAETVHYSLGAAAVGLLVGMLLASLLALAGVLAVEPLLVVWGGGLALLGALVAGGLTAVGRYYYPKAIAYRRGRHIDAMLPHAVLFLFALVHGGVLPQQVVQRLADAEEVYGEVSVEFDRFVTDTQWLGSDVYQAIERAAERSPSTELTAFFEEWANLLEMGGDVPAFLEQQVESQLERVEESQEQFLEQVETASEAYVVLIFAGPIFLFVVLIIMSFFSPVAMVLLRLLVYGFIPIGLAFFLWFFGHLIGPLQYSLGQVRFGAERAPRTGIEGTTAETEQQPHRAPFSQRAKETVRNVLARDLTRIQQQPTRLFVVTGPIAVVVTAALVLSGVVPLGVKPIFQQPVVTGSGLFVVPFAVATLPVAAAHEWNQRRMRQIQTRFPAALRVIADSNRNGVPLADSFGAVAEEMSGPLGDEIETTYRDIQWFHDIETALEALADRLSVPVISRLIYLLTASLESTNRIADIADVVADDLEARNRLLERRRERMQAYVFIVFMGVIVYLVIVTLFDIAFLPAIARFTTERKSVIERVPIRLGALDVDIYRRLFFHTALIQAVGNGFILGRLEANSLTSGLKYSNLFLLFVVALFFSL